jgi:hypothetical protein
MNRELEKIGMVANIVGWIVVALIIWFALGAMVAWGQPPPAWDDEFPLETKEPEIIAPPVKVVHLTYLEMLKKAVAENRPLVVGYGCPPVVPTGYLSFAAHTEGEPFIMVTRKGDKGLYFPPSVSVGEVRKWIDAGHIEGKVQPSASPFETDNLKSSSGEYLLDSLPTADDDPSRPRSWPESVPYPRGLMPYLRAKLTQEIATTNNLPRITPVPRSATLPKWRTSGGMEGIHGFKSEVFKLVPGEEYGKRELVPVRNSFGNMQHELAYTRSYPDGTVFVDHLTNTETGKAFETRIAEKQNGEWTRYVAFRDKSQRPAGYNGLRGMTCVTCHNRSDGPGTGGYGVGLVPGSDTVVSDPLIGLER